MEEKEKAEVRQNCPFKEDYRVQTCIGCQLWLPKLDEATRKPDPVLGICSVALIAQATNGLAQMMGQIVNMMGQQMTVGRGTPGAGLYIPRGGN